MNEKWFLNRDVQVITISSFSVNVAGWARLNSRYFKNVQKISYKEFWTKKFQCQPSLHTPSSLSLLRLPKLASLPLELRSTLEISNKKT